jgi:ribonuclease HI
VTDEKGKLLKFVKHEGADIRTVNEEEYLGVIAALKMCSAGDIIYTDSQLVYGHLCRGWKCNYDHLRSLRDEAAALMGARRAGLKWVKRNKNVAGVLMDKM